MPAWLTALVLYLVDRRCLKLLQLVVSPEAAAGLQQLRLSQAPMAGAPGAGADGASEPRVEGRSAALELASTSTKAPAQQREQLRCF